MRSSNNSQRNTVSRQPLSLLRGAAIIGLLFGAQIAAAQDPLVPYTVQIAALSDAESAIGLSGQLLRDGFPGYVVRAEGAAGAVYRVRVAAFGDRSSADRYATTMGDQYGGAPQPALAEAIPAGILPLAPRLVARMEDGSVAELVSWGDGLALYVADPNGPGTYALLSVDESFTAWWAAPTEDGGRDEIVQYSLDGEGAAQDDAAVRDALFRQRLRLVAEASGLDAAEVEAGAVRGEPGERFLIVWRTVSGQTASDIVRGVLRSDADPSAREPEAWIGAVPPEPVTPILRVDPAEPEGLSPVSVEEVEPVSETDAVSVTDAGSEADTPADAEASVSSSDDETSTETSNPNDVMGVAGGETWVARADGPWTVLEIAGSSWRALAGEPVRGLDGMLLVRVEGAYELVRLLPR